jgi:hypothetical protein
MVMKDIHLLHDETARESNFSEVSARGEPHVVPQTYRVNQKSKRLTEGHLSWVNSIPIRIKIHSTWRFIIYASESQKYPTLVAGLATDRENIFAFQTKKLNQ